MKRILATVLCLILLLTPALALADTVAVTGNNVNIRTGPGTSYESLGKLKKGTALEKLGESGDWTQVSYNGGTAYISSRYVKATEATAAGTASGSTTGYTVTGKVQATANANVRSGPGTNYSRLGALKKGSTYDMLGKSGGWTYLLFNGKPAYVSSTYLKTVSGGSSGTSTTTGTSTSTGTSTGTGSTGVEAVSSKGFLTDLAEEAMALTNQVRKENGRGTLKVDDTLVWAAQIRCNELVQKFGHTRPNGGAPNTIHKSILGENIARADHGYLLTARSIIVDDGFMTSSGHRANMLEKRFTKIGMAAQTVNGMTYWVQLFG